MTTAQKNALAQKIVRNVAQHYNMSMYTALVIASDDPEITVGEVKDISHRVVTILEKAQIPPELLQAEVKRSEWDGEL